MLPAKARTKRAEALARDRRKTVRKVAAMQRLDCSQTYVRHPRYGATPLRSGDLQAQHGVRKYFRGFHPRVVPNEVFTGSGLFYPASAIRVRSVYWSARGSGAQLCMDHGQKCRNCGRWFLLWALEQKYWLEVLGLRGAACFDCFECRRDRHYVERLAGEYEALLTSDDKTVEQWERFAAVGDRLFELGYIKKPGTLQKTRMPKRMQARLLR